MPESTAATFAFADIAGFTALTEAHGDEEAVALVGEFCAAVDAELPAVHGVRVKTIGDAVMLRIPDPADAVRVGLRIAGGLLREHGAPSVRVGLHHGPAVTEPVDLFAALPIGASETGRLPVDPVCRMVVDPDRAAGRLLHDGEAFYFCSLTCAGQFAQQPGRFVA